MANIRRRKPKGANMSTKISIPSILSVSRLAPVKRQSYEVEDLDNVLISLERNVEKRAGFTVIPQDTIGAATYAGGWDFSSNNTKPELFQLSSLTPADLWYYWYNINEDTRFLIVVDFSASTKDSQLFYMYQLLTYPPVPSGTLQIQPLLIQLQQILITVQLFRLMLRLIPSAMLLP